MLVVPDAKRTIHLPKPTYTILGYSTCPDFNLILISGICQHNNGTFLSQMKQNGRLLPGLTKY